jgi:hypothetical protein
MIPVSGTPGANTQVRPPRTNSGVPMPRPMSIPGREIMQDTRRLLGCSEFANPGQPPTRRLLTWIYASFRGPSGRRLR